MTHSKEKNKSAVTVPEKELMANILDNDFFKTVFKNAQRTIGRYGESQENDVGTKWKLKRQKT